MYEVRHMTAQDVHQAAVKYANEHVEFYYGVEGPYEAGTKEHAFWLEQYDGYVKEWMGNE